MLLNNDEKVIQETYENALLTRELLEKEGFKCVGDTVNYEIYKYCKSGLGVVQLDVYSMRDLPNVNFGVYSHDSIVAVVNVVNPITRDFEVQENSTRFLLTFKDLKNYLKFRKLLTKIRILEQQAADMLNNDTLSDKQDYDKRIRGEKV